VKANSWRDLPLKDLSTKGEEGSREAGQGGEVEAGRTREGGRSKSESKLVGSS